MAWRALCVPTNKLKKKYATHHISHHKHTDKNSIKPNHPKPRRSPIHTKTYISRVIEITFGLFGRSRTQHGNNIYFQPKKKTTTHEAREEQSVSRNPVVVDLLTSNKVDHPRGLCAAIDDDGNCAARVFNSDSFTASSWTEYSRIRCASSYIYDINGGYGEKHFGRITANIRNTRM